MQIVASAIKCKWLPYTVRNGTEFKSTYISYCLQYYIYLFLLHTLSKTPPTRAVCLPVCPYAVLYLHTFLALTLSCLCLHQLVLFTYKSCCCCCNCCRGGHIQIKLTQTTKGVYLYKNRAKTFATATGVCVAYVICVNIALIIYIGWLSYRT